MLSAHEQLDDNLAFTIADFTRQYGDTDALLDEAQWLLDDDEATLRSQLTSLTSAISEYMSAKKPKLNPDEFKAVVEEHLRKFKTPQQEVQQRATELWQRYQQLSNRLDYMQRDIDEFRQLDAECDAVKADYDQAHAENTLLYNKYRQEVAKWAYASFFNPLFLDVTINSLHDICTAILATLADGKEDSQ